MKSKRYLLKLSDLSSILQLECLSLGNADSVTDKALQLIPVNSIFTSISDQVIRSKKHLKSIFSVKLSHFDAKRDVHRFGKTRGLKDPLRSIYTRVRFRIRVAHFIKYKNNYFL
jgi:hypothetical protein